MNETLKRERQQQEERRAAEELRRQAELNRQSEDGKRQEPERGEERRKAAQPTQQREPQGAYKRTQVDIDYRYAMDRLKESVERWEAAQRGDPARPERAEGKESPAMARYKAHQETLKPKVEEHLKALEKARAPELGRDR